MVLSASQRALAGHWMSGSCLWHDCALNVRGLPRPAQPDTNGRWLADMVLPYVARLCVDKWVASSVKGGDIGGVQ